jgi:hypothetical protein
LDVLLHPNGPRDADWTPHFASKTTPLFIVDFPLADSTSGYHRVVIVMAFCWAVHKTLAQIRMGRSASGASERAVSLTLELKNIWAPAKPKPKRKKPG